MTLDPTMMLAGGGILAVLAAGWRQVRTVFTYISSFLVVRASIDEGIQAPMRLHLKQHWKPLPSGLLVYMSTYLRLRNKAHYSPIPFRVIAQNAVYRKGWKFIIVNVSNSGATLIGIRGMINFDKLIVEALKHGEDRWNDDARRTGSSRFQVVQIVGREKGDMSFGNKSRGSSVGETEPAASNSSSDITGSKGTIDIGMDTSIMYERNEYLYDTTVDPFSTLYYDPEVDKYIKQAQQWLDMGTWYTERQIPWRRGWLLYGPGGTGKSSLAKAIAQQMRIPLYHFYLATLSDQEFMQQWRQMMMPCMVLFEDFDTVFDGRENVTEHKSLTFDCILNQTSGVNSPSGTFLVVTTNHIEKIDPALGVAQGENGVSTRPGRVDTVIHLGYMSEHNRRRMAQQILRDWPEEVEHMVNGPDTKLVTPVQFQEMLIQLAFERLNKQEGL
jgi:hypothetical protein